MILFAGIGRLIVDSNIIPEIIPIWLFGMDDVLPNKKPYIPQVGQVSVKTQDLDYFALLNYTNQV